MPRFLSVLGLVLVLGCYSGPAHHVGRGLKAPVQVHPGLIYGQYLTPLSTDFRATPVGQRRGQVDIHYIDLWVLLGAPHRLDFTYGTADLAQAARAGGISTIHQADLEYMHVLGIYNRVSLIVHGE